MKTKGKDITCILEKKIQMSLTFATIMNQDKLFKAKLILKDVLLRVLYIELLISKGQNWRSSFIFVQINIRNRCHAAKSQSLVV